MLESDRDKAKYGLLRILRNATGIYRRTIPERKKGIYWKSLKKIIKELTWKIDRGKIVTNNDIRNSIRKLSKICDISIGASQKVINVYLKYYCIIANKDNSILKILDCPIDSNVVKKNKYLKFKKLSLKNLDFDFSKYKEMQNKLEKKYKGMKILADIKAYDEKKAN